MIGYILKGIIPLIIVLVIIYGAINGVKVYECFVEGAKDGIHICLRIFPYLLAMILAVKVFRESGAMDYLMYFINPVVKFVGIPVEIVPLILIKPLSGSGALGVYSDIIKQYGADTSIGLISSIIMGSTETIFYTVTVYFGAVGIKKVRHTVWAAVMADLVAIIVATFIVKLLIL